MSQIPEQVLELCLKLRSAGFQAWVVGGCVRDLFLGREPHDWDITTSARPEQVMALFSRVIPTGIDHGTVTVMVGSEGYEVTTFRGEAAYSDGRRPDAVFYVDSIEADLARRDFTMNAVAMAPAVGSKHELADPFDGVADIEAKTIRAVGKASERFAEDGLRVMRAARFAATLGFTLDPATEAAIAPSLESFRRVSPERIRDEWVKACKAREPSRAFRIMRDHGMMEIIAPELVLNGTVLDRLDRFFKASSPVIRLAALFDDAATADTVMTRLRTSTAERQQVVTLVKNITFASILTGPQIRTYMSRIGLPLVPDWVALRCAIGPATRFKAAVEKELASNPPLSLKDLAVTGHDLQGLGFRGPALGATLKMLLEAVIENPDLNRPETLMGLVEESLTSS